MLTKLTIVATASRPETVDWVRAMGADPVDSLRQMKNVASDPYSRGRNFAGHYSVKKWNVAPISSPIEVQYSIAPGTAMAQRAAKSKGITIVQGGDAGTAEGDFATCLIWASRPGAKLPVLMIVTNNEFGISTPAGTQHGEKHIADRGKAFEIETAIIFALPTVGPAIVGSMAVGDVYVTATFMMVLAATLIVGNIIADMLLAMLDPRVREFGRA